MTQLACISMVSGELPETALLPMLIDSSWPLGVQKVPDATVLHVSRPDISVGSSV